MKLIPEWRKELNRLWTVKLSVASVLLGLLDFASQVLPALGDFIPPRAFAVLSIVAALGVPLARVIKQDDTHAA